MAKLPKDWERRLVELAAIHGVSDFLLRGRLTKAESKVFYAILNKIGRPAARQTGLSAARLGGTALQVGKTIALRHPYLTAGAIIYYTYKNRDEIADLVEQGYEIVQPVADPVVQPIVGAGRELLDITKPGRQELFEAMQPRPAPIPLPGIVEKFRPRKKSNYNKAVSAGMKAIKNSTSFGKKGVIKPAQSAFKTVVSVGKAIKAKRKRPKKGIRSKVYTAMKRFYK